MLSCKQITRTRNAGIAAALSCLVFVVFVAVGCGGGGGGGESGRGGGSSGADFGCDGGCAPRSLSVAQVNAIVTQATAGARQLGVAATVAVLDRVGNVLAVYRMAGAPSSTVINGQIGAAGGLEGVTVPATLAAISKAGTGAYLSSQGNSFSTRTASQIVQENFNPGERNQPGGPLFGVQFSQLACSDVTLSTQEAGGSVGPRPLPLGLSADPGGLPLYIDGDLVGGVGVELDGSYRVDRNVFDTDDDFEERIAMTATLGFEAPSQRIAPNVNLGKSLRYTDLSYEEIDPLPENLPSLEDSGFVNVPLYFSGTPRPGVAFGSPASGVAATVRAGVASANLTAGGPAPRFPSRGGSALGGAELSAREVEALLDSSLLTASRARAAIRRPLDTGARVSIWIVDHRGVPLGFTRSQDAPVFGIDVALQKARAAAFFSSPDAASALRAVQGGRDYVGAMQAFVDSAVLSGRYAFSARAVGNLARPFFTDGINGNSNGPLSLPFPGSAPGSSWSPFNTGLQLQLVLGALVQPILGGSIPAACVNAGSRLANGIQIFPGAVPLYRGSTLIGAIGVSGDGIDQDDLIAFYGASHRGLEAAGHAALGDAQLGFNAPVAMRADTIDHLPNSSSRLRYVNCPEAPFGGSNEQNVCDGV